MGTFASIQARVETRVIDLPSAVLAEIPTLVNEAVKRIQRLHNFKVMETEEQYTTTIATRAIGAVPSDYKEPRGNPYEQLFDGSTRLLHQAPSLKIINRYFADDAEGFPAFTLDPEPDDTGARSFQVWPLPDGNSDYSDGEYRIHVPYWRFLPALSAGGSTNWFTVNAEEYIVNQATAEAFALDWDEDRSVYWATKAGAELNLVLKQDKMFAIAHLDVLVPHRGARSTMLEH